MNKRNAHAKRIYDLKTDPCGKAGSMSNAEEELVDNLQYLGEKAIPTPPSPDDIFSLDILKILWKTQQQLFSTNTNWSCSKRKGTWKGNPNANSKHCLMFNINFISAMQ